MKKPKVRDARFPNRNSSTPSARPSGGASSPPPSQPQPRPATPGPRGAAPSRGAAAPRGGSAPAPEPPSTPSPLPPWLNANLIVPVVLALGAGGAIYALVKERTPPTPVAVVADAGSSTPAPAPAAATDAAPARTPETGAVPAVQPARDAAAGDAVTAGDASEAGAPSNLDGSPVEAAHAEPSTPDPRRGRFALDDATRGIPGSGGLVAEIDTSMGAFTCDLLPGEAPNTVANFIGLARGLRDYWDPVSGQWVRRPFYDGSIFHRVIPDFMIQGGDILRSGMGGTGYEFADENVNGHNAAGLLCMANRGPNTNGGQFFITDAPKPHLDGSYSIFGRCRPADLVGRIARVARDANDRPHEPVFIRTVRVRHAER